MQLHPLFYWRSKSSAVRRRYEEPCRYHLRKVLVAGNERVTWQLKKWQRTRYLAAQEMAMKRGIFSNARKS